MRIGSVSLLGFPVPARFSARTLNLYFFLVGRPLTLQRTTCLISTIKSNKEAREEVKISFRQQTVEQLDSPVVGVFDGQFVASHPFVVVRFVSLHPVSGDGTSSVLIRLIPGESH